jgi:predicted DCC family thiol-disulfide oxidoreductase YuxK
MAHAILPCGEVRYGEISDCPQVGRMAKHSELSVLYNAQCPVCDLEIGQYARYAEKAGLPIRFDDLNTDARDRWGLDADTAARRLYVQHDGMLVSGVPAFLVLWSQMPRYRLMGQIVGLPGIRQIASMAYDHILAPALYRWHRRRLGRTSIGE